MSISSLFQLQIQVSYNTPKPHKQVVSSEILFQMDMNILTNSIEAGTRIEDLLDVTAMELI